MEWTGIDMHERASHPRWWRSPSRNEFLLELLEPIPWQGVAVEYRLMYPLSKTAMRAIRHHRARRAEGEKKGSNWKKKGGSSDEIL